MEVLFDKQDQMLSQLYKKGRLERKFVMYTHKTKGVVTEIFSAGFDHASYAKNRRVSKKKFIGAGRCIQDAAWWESPSCKKEYDRDQPSDESEADALIEDFRQALMAIMTPPK